MFSLSLYKALSIILLYKASASASKDLINMEQESWSPLSQSLLLQSWERGAAGKNASIIIDRPPPRHAAVHLLPKATMPERKKGKEREWLLVTLHQHKDDHILKSKWERAALNTISQQASKAFSILQKLLQFEKRCKEQDRKHIGPKHMLSFLPWKERKKERNNQSIHQENNNRKQLFIFVSFSWFLLLKLFFNRKKVEEECVKKNPPPDTNTATTTTTTQSGYAKRQKRM